jgi:hypothetical protein
MHATIAKNEIPVRHSDRGELGEYLTIDVPNGWDDVKKICKKVLTFNGKKFLFTGWNSDSNDCYFRHTGQEQIATFK